MGFHTANVANRNGSSMQTGSGGGTPRKIGSDMMIGRHK
jgi:hypothetical protein